MSPPSWNKYKKTVTKEIQLTETNIDGGELEAADDDLRARIDRLEQTAGAYRQESESRIIQAEMKVHALRAGMVDLDGLKFLDLAAVSLTGDGQVDRAAEMLGELRRAKPWLFGASSSSSVRPPPSKAAQSKLATEMTDEEYRVAREKIIRRSTH